MFFIIFAAKNRIMAHSLEYDYAVCDLVLRMFDDYPNGMISHEQLRQARMKTHVPDEDEVFSFLVEEGLLKETGYGYEITHRGRIVIHGGGYAARIRRERLVRICAYIGAVSGVIAAVASIVALLR